MFDVWELNIAIEVWGAAFCVVGIVCSLLLVRTDMRYRNLLVVMFTLELLAALGDAVTIYSKGHVDPLAFAMTHGGNFLVYACSFLLQAAVVSYLCQRIHEMGGAPYHTWRMGVNALAVAMCVFAAFGAFYYFDDANLYHRADAYWLTLAFVAIVSMANSVLVVRNRAHLGNAAFACLLFYTLAPIVASIVQSAVYGPNLAIAAGVVGLVVVFLEMQVHSARVLVEQAEALAGAEADAANSRIAVMVAQMQPHFLFNTLDTIYGLVGEDDDAARGAIASFSQYLRTSLDSLNRAEPVPIQTELQHVRTYLELERTSDPDRVAYEFDVQATGFSVPALSVQTLAENAVKHGIGAKVEGGTVTVRTRELPQEFTVSIADDGVGFGEEKPNDGRVHVGIENTRKRLESMCGGTLEVRSEPGAGTIAIMHLPKSRGEAQR